MKILKYLLFFIILYILLSIIYSYILSPRIKIINHKSYDIKLFKGESNANSIEPSLKEVESMLNSTTIIKPQKSYSFDIKREYILSNENNKVNISLRNADSINETSSEYSNEFIITDDGFCKYIINVYNNYAEVETSDFNICYKKLLIIK